MPRKLGKQPPEKDPRTLRAADYIDVERLATGPLDLTAKVPAWPMYANDEIGDCGPADCAHQIIAWTAAEDRLYAPSRKDVIDFYSRVSGYRPEDPSTDVGVNMLAMLKKWRTEGLGGHKILAFMELDIRDRPLAQSAAFLFGGLNLGYSLPEFVQRTSRWYMADRRKGNDEPGSWGGHAVNRVLHVYRRKQNVSWGGLIPVTHEFDREYCDEAYAVLSQDWMGPDGKAPNGFDVDRLMHDLARL